MTSASEGNLTVTRNWSYVHPSPDLLGQVMVGSCKTRSMCDK